MLSMWGLDSRSGILGPCGRSGQPDDHGRRRADDLMLGSSDISLGRAAVIFLALAFAAGSVYFAVEGRWMNAASTLSTCLIFTWVATRKHLRPSRP